MRRSSVRHRGEGGHREEPARRIHSRCSGHGHSCETNLDDNGFIAPKNIGKRIGSKCLIGMQVQNGKFVQIDPANLGTFDCNGGVISLIFDPAKACKG